MKSGKRKGGKSGNAALAKLSTAELEIEQLRRAIERTDIGIAQMNAAIWSMQQKQIVRVNELARQQARLNAEREIAATVRRMKGGR